MFTLFKGEIWIIVQFFIGDYFVIGERVTSADKYMSAGKHQAYGILECRGAGAGGIILYVALSKVWVILPPE